MVIALILILASVLLFLIFRDDHDDSYTRTEKPRREKKSRTPKPAVPPQPVMREPRTIVPEEKIWQPSRFTQEAEVLEERVDLSFLERMEYHEELPDRILSSFIAGFHRNARPEDMAGVAGYVQEMPDGLEVRTAEGRLLGHLPMRDRVSFHAVNPQGFPCPFAGHVGISTTGTYYADIRIAVPSSREFAERSLREFLG